MTPRPSPEELLAAKDRKVPDLIAHGLQVLFCGINPGLYSAAVGHHFARPGNRFWPALHRGGFTPRTLLPSEERTLLSLGYGITNLVERATASADELRPDEFVAGGAALRRKVLRYRPAVVAILGIGAFRVALDRPGATVGPQSEPMGDAHVWLLPSPSGLNAHYQADALVREFRRLRRFVERIQDRQE